MGRASPAYWPPVILPQSGQKDYEDGRQCQHCGSTRMYSIHPEYDRCRDCGKDSIVIRKAGYKQVYP